MDDLKNFIPWAEREEKRKARERFRRTCRYWPIISMATIVFGGLSFLMLGSIRGMVFTIVTFVASVIVSNISPNVPATIKVAHYRGVILICVEHCPNL